ncbi:MAG: flagellar export chaperone FliS [Gammaproteobacteria bacterium]|nr:flagellar export chaperone FliS [Gammaproteobacteria bacterium]MDH5629190.1 flagellar export chaperone FliS [Gammaproteobacteria bacterium]
MGLTGTLAYSNVNAVSGVENADPHRLIQMLIDGAIEKMNRAKFFILNNDFEQRSRHINWSISIINGLRSSLDMENGGEISQQLESLYDFCVATLVEANFQNSEEKVNDALAVMLQIKEGWDGIRHQIKE